MKEEHREAIEDVYESQLQKCQDRIQDMMQNRHIPKAEDRGLDTIVIIVEKDSNPEQDEFYEYPYYIARIQRHFAVTKKRWFRTQYRNHKFIVEEMDNANNIHAFNRFEEQVCIERRHCHFRLVGLGFEKLYALE